jgi:nucleotide-binding universal stress UspA family protein
VESFRPKLILVPTDFSETAARALRYASALGQRFGAHLLVMHADQFLSAVDCMTLPIGAFNYPDESTIERSRESLQRHAEENISTTVPFDVKVVVGVPVRAIAAQIKESGADLIVMGTHGRSGLSRLVFGSVTEEVMQSATVPVIAVNSEVSEMAHVEKVLCPVSYSETSREALRHAAALVESRRAPLVLIRGVRGGDPHIGTKEFMRLQRWLPTELVDRCEIRLCVADSAEAIVNVAYETHADLIVLGVEPGTSVYDTLQGTVAEQVVQRSHCAVLTMNVHSAGTMQKMAAPPMFESVY